MGVNLRRNGFFALEKEYETKKIVKQIVGAKKFNLVYFVKQFESPFEHSTSRMNMLRSNWNKQISHRRRIAKISLTPRTRTKKIVSIPSEAFLFRILLFLKSPSKFRITSWPHKLLIYDWSTFLVGLLTLFVYHKRVYCAKRCSAKMRVWYW